MNKNTVLAKYHVELVREDTRDYMNKSGHVTSPESLAEIITKLFALEGMCQEHFGALFLDTKHEEISAHVFNIGTISSSLVDVRSICQMALLTNASSVAVFHNHPSGNTTPSPEDDKVTMRIKCALELLGINLLDHVIMGDGSYFSYKEHGKI